MLTQVQIKKSPDNDSPPLPPAAADEGDSISGLHYKWALVTPLSPRGSLAIHGLTLFGNMGTNMCSIAAQHSSVEIVSCNSC